MKNKNFKLATYKNIRLEDIDEAFTYFNKEDMDEMNASMRDVLDSLYMDCSYRERLVFEDIFKKAYVSAFILVEDRD